MNGSDRIGSIERSPQTNNDRERLIPRDPQAKNTLPPERTPGEVSAFEFLQEHQSASTAGAPGHAEMLPPANIQPLSSATNYPPRTSSLPGGATALNPRLSDDRIDTTSTVGTPLKSPDVVEKDLHEKGSQKSVRESVSRFFKFHKKEDKKGKP